MDREELTAWLRLILTPALGAVAQRKLLAAFGLPQQVFAASPAALRAVATPSQVRALHAEPPHLAKVVDATLAWLEAGLTPGGRTRRLLTLADPDYPPALLHTDDPPLLLHAMGAALARGPLAWPQRALAMVGSRNPTPQGAANARQFASAFSRAGWTVVSGLALGVDAAAHEGALEGAQQSTASSLLATIAVVGTGLDRVYPSQHRELARRVAERGFLLSEFAIGTPPLRDNFPRRNRLIAALSQGTVVVEAALQSGSLITARLAAEMGRDVFAIPGSIHSPQARGCHTLIKQGAQLVETADDVLGNLGGMVASDANPGPDQAVPPSTAPRRPASGSAPLLEPAPTAAVETVLQALGFAPTGFDDLAARTGLGTAALQARLLELELEGTVGRLPGGLFQRVVRA